MALLSDETKYNIKLGWFTFVQAIYSFPPIQRVVLIGGLLLLVPGYWVARVSADWYHTHAYKKMELVAHASFTDPQPLNLTQVRVFPFSDSSYVGYVKIINPNLDLSVYSAAYTFKFTNTKGEEVYTTNGTFYLLPGQEQYIVTSRFTPPATVVGGTLEIANIHWQKRFQLPTVKLSTPAAIVQNAPEVDGIKIEGSVVNESAYVLGTVRITFLIKDASGKLLGIVQRDENTVRPKERRAFPQVWPALGGLSGTVFIETLATTNALDARNLQVEKAGTFPVEAEDD